MASATKGMPKAKFKTAFGRAVGYIYLHAPDTAFGKSEYKAAIKLEAAEAQPLVKQTKALIKKAIDDGDSSSPPTPPYKKNDDGSYTFKFKTQHEPALFDAAGKPLDSGLRVGGGSLMRVAGTAQVYEGFGNTGVTLYMNGVQIKELETFSGGGGDAEDFGFDATEGFSGGDIDDSADLFGDDDGDLDSDPLDGDSDWDDDF